MQSDHKSRIKRARIALEGLSVADAFGGFFEFNHRVLESYIASRRLPNVDPWHFTDDTNMALSIYEVLSTYGCVHQDYLAESFARHFDPQRGYGAGARRVLTRIQEGEDWREVASTMFGGQGSYGNGAAMRVAPLGAFYADDLAEVTKQAKCSSDITHTHPEAVAGAIATSVAAAVACRYREGDDKPTPAQMLETVIDYVPASEVRSRLVRATQIRETTDVQNAAAMLGNGSHVSAVDTVPFALWCAAHYLDDYENAFWQTASAGGDVDTNCAIACAVVVCFVGQKGIPSEWLDRREPLPAWAFANDQA